MRRNSYEIHILREVLNIPQVFPSFSFGLFALLVTGGCTIITASRASNRILVGSVLV